LDIAIRPTNDFFSVSNDEKGIADAIKRIKPLAPKRVLIESTGRLEMAFACAAFKVGLPVVVCNAMMVHNFAKAAGQLAKTDKLDAFIIAHYGEAMQPSLTELNNHRLKTVG